MWVLKALIIHLLFLGSIFVIYFRSPVISGQSPQKSLTEYGFAEPAKRLVLIVTDGLRADSFFRNNCDDIPFIRKLMKESGGLVGISHTRVPTESRPGHIALIAGLYEDPSAVTRGWKENPVDFDTLFNRSDYTYAWGAKDILHIFSRTNSTNGNIFIDTYDNELDFSGRDNTFELDSWVFERVKQFLKRNVHRLREKRKIVFFLHLLGLDSAGHIHKPNSELFLKNLHATDQGIANIYKFFEKTFPDNGTAYVLTSDHGMTNTGSHGAGDPSETETPFFLWGAGFVKNNLPSIKLFQAANEELPLYEIEQGQMATLMSTVLGVAPPMNNFGILPYRFLNTSDNYKAYAVHINALQLLEQYETLLRNHQKGYFASYLRSFKKLEPKDITSYKVTFSTLMKYDEYYRAIKVSNTVMHNALQGIDYYHGYYRNALLFSTAATFITWICYMLQLLFDETKLTTRICTRELAVHVVLLISIPLFIFLILQQVPFVIGLYLLLPVFTLGFLIEKWHEFLSVIQQYILMSHVLLIIFCAELLVFTFFERKLISIGYLLFGLINNKNLILVKDGKFCTWLVLTVSLACFPLLPPSVGYKNNYFLIAAMLIILMRPFVVKSYLDWKTILITTISLANAILCIYQHTNQIVVWRTSHIISWLYLFYCFASIILYPVNTPKRKLEFIFFKLSSLYALMCTSYEALFVIMLASELTVGLSAQQAIQLDYLSVIINKNSIKNLQTAFRLALTILLYTFFSFFGTGNIASVSSFDPNIIRCFLSTFSPFTIMALVILKLIVPVVLNIAIIFGMSSFARANERNIFICLLLICDIMGLNFLFLVRNQGSWLEIGSSISHFVIMEVTTVVLLLLTKLAKLFLGFKTVITLKKV